MTTAVRIECPEHSHWHLKIEVRDRVYDQVAKKMTDDWTLSESFVLKQTENRTVYIHDSRKLEVSEIVPEPVVPAAPPE
jgi:hypothetical protein